MGSIILLDDNTINKIAAGEVVDRPSSIVKELVENSIDAHSKNINVEIKNGGISYIKVEDDGDGFKSDDVELAFERHATSKIAKEADILKITSMGFRGEALASIAAISRVLLITKNKDEEFGTKIQIEGGNILYKEKSGSNKGTTICIKDVFFNTPARYKFLKKDHTEASYIEDVMIRIALANPEISIKYINNGKTIISTNGDGNLHSVIYNVFGKNFYDNVAKLDYDYEGIKVEGAIGLAAISRSTRSDEYTYINSRYIKNKTIMSAIEKAYSEKLAINKFPFVVINVKLRPETIDVNVHPSKLEVKFENEGKVFEAVYFAIRSTLEEENRKKNPFSILKEEIISENINLDNKNDIKSGYIDNGVPNSTIMRDININKSLYNREKYILNKEQNNILNIDNVDNIDNISNQDKEIGENESNINDANYNYDKAYIQDNKFDTNLSFNENKESLKSEEKKEDDKIILNNTLIPELKQEEIIEVKESTPVYKYIGSLFDTYIIIEIKDKMYIIDQHAAHERLYYERFKQNYYSGERCSQMLMIPFLVDLKASEVEIVFENLEYFEKAGYIIEKFGDKTVKISGVPTVGSDKLDDQSSFIDMVDELIRNAKTDRQNKEFRFLATLACKAAVKGNNLLTKEEHIKLLDEMLTLDNPFTCPHGRPLAYEISKAEIEKKVDRR